MFVIVSSSGMQLGYETVNVASANVTTSLLITFPAPDDPTNSNS